MTSKSTPPTAPADPVAAGLAGERVIAAQEAETAALDAIVASGTDDGVDAIIAGAAPDDVARMRA